MTAEKYSPFLSGGSARRDRLPVLVGPLVGVLAALVCGISVLTGVVVVLNMQQELGHVRQENSGLRERLAAVENLLETIGSEQGDISSTKQDEAVRVKRQAIGSSALFGNCPQGAPGPPGRDGRDGVAVAGRDGTDGQPGTVGTPGRDGRDGVPGSQGPAGPTGPIGMQGPSGAKGDTGAPDSGGAVYVRWGRKTCPDSGSETLYSGVAGGTHYTQTGGGTNYQCLPTNPQWGPPGTYQDGVEGNKAYMYGAEYETNTNVPFGSTSQYQNDVPCAVCYVPTRGSKLMIPARNTCYSGWTEEYHGYLMAEYYNHAGAKEFVCVDGQPEAVPGGQASHNGALFYPVEARCGSLPCTPGSYVEGRELTCVVCTK